MLITKKIACDENGVALEAVEYSSKSGDNFNHEAKMPRSITNKQPCNHYPRGRVGIKNNKATVFINPVLHTSAIIELIDIEFGLCGGAIPVRMAADGSAHYEYQMEIE